MTLTGVPQPGKGFTIAGLGVDMNWIPAGSFSMGSPAGETGRSENETQHTVELTQGFWLARTETTQKQYADMRMAWPSYFKNAGDTVPVETVSWDDAMEYCRLLTRRESTAGRLPQGFEYTLPSEAQWEYAARAGSTGAFHDRDVGAIAWFGSNSGNTIHAVAQLQPNAWGLHDMLGGVSEWCFDTYADYPTGPVKNPEETSTAAGRRILRGGNYNEQARHCRTAARSKRSADDPGPLMGFRPALRLARK